MAVDTTTMVTGAPSRKAPKTIEGQWQAVKPPWGRRKVTEPDNLSVSAYLNNKFHVSMTYICIPYVTMIHTVSTTITQALYYSNYYVYMTYL